MENTVGTLFEVVDDNQEEASLIFHSATAFVERHTSSFSDAVLLQLYAYFKQATQGPCPPGKRPGLFDIRGRSKYDAWLRIGPDISTKEAQQLYVKIVSKHVPDWQQQQQAQCGRTTQIHGPVFSMPVTDDGDDADEEFPKVIQYVQRGDLAALKSLIEESPGVVADRDTEGCTALHWAADKGHEAMVRVLLDHGADVNATDIDGQRPLEYAMAMTRSGDTKAYLESALAYADT